tara:strand:- start:116 stop:907 length:792 start_codon:yes stop_codon:yes gene_type:complete
MKDNKVSSLLDIIKFNNTKLKGKNIKISEVYGKERFCYLLYSLIRMEQPNTVVELGTGLGTCALLVAQALKENNKGIIWTIDNGADWADYKESFQKIFKTHKDYFNSLIKKFNLKPFIKLISNFDISKNLVYDPKKKIDILFVDAQDSDPLSCMNVLRGYLPLMNSRSSIFIDRAPTINHSYLLLEKIISELQNNRVSNSLVDGLPRETQELIYKMVLKSKFTLINLTEDDNNKLNKSQNSTAWIKIEPLDFVFKGNVRNVMG